MKRRSFLKGTGVIMVLLAGGVVWRAHDQGVFSAGEGRAYEPWHDWRSDRGTGPLTLVSAAILAASPHNTQPWLFRVTDRSVELYADTRRNLGMFDPYLREMHIGLGCAVENMMLTAAAQGYKVELSLAPAILTRIPEKPEPVLAAGLALTFGAAEKSSLQQAIHQRHTNRAGYDMSRPLPPEMLGNLANLAKDETDLKLFLYNSDAERKRVADVLVEATKTIISDQQMEADSQRWIRNRWSDQMAQVLAAVTGDSAWQATFSFRMGYPTTEAPPSPRRPVEDVIV